MECGLFTSQKSANYLNQKGKNTKEDKDGKKGNAMQTDDNSTFK